MVKFILTTFILVLSVQNIWARTNQLNGTITVLEAPIFAVPDEKSNIIEYYRKGQSIYLHPMEGHTDKYAELEFKNIRRVEADKISDPFLDEKGIYLPSKESSFYKTIARSGREAYVLKEHVLVNYKDSREFDREVIEFDHTDYRIQEPLPKNYPLSSPKQHKHSMNLALYKSNFDSYPYLESVGASSAQMGWDFNFSWISTQKVDELHRFWFGGVAGFRQSSINYRLDSNGVSSASSSQEINFQFYIGPFASYDIYKGPKSVLSLYTTLQYSIIDQVDIAMTSPLGTDSRVYNSRLSFTQLIGFNYQSYNTLKKFDSVFGSYLKINYPRFYTTSENADIPELWQSSDSYLQALTTEASFYFGIQSRF